MNQLVGNNLRVEKEHPARDIIRSRESCEMYGANGQQPMVGTRHGRRQLRRLPAGRIAEN